MPVLCTAGISGWAPCRLRRHGHSASIPHAFAPAALRALLASRGKPRGYRFRSPYYIVDRLFGAAELRLGGDKGDVVRIERTDGVSGGTRRN